MKKPVYILSHCYIKLELTVYLVITFWSYAGKFNKLLPRILVNKLDSTVKL